MVETKIYKGNTIDETIEQAAMDLNIPKEKLDYEILNKGSSGFLGILSRSAEIKVIIPTYKNKTKNIVSELLELMKFDSKIEIEEQNKDVFLMHIGTDTDGLLIGKQGRTLSAIQHIVNRILNHNEGERIKVVLDVGNYRSNRDEQLKEKALRIAKRAKKTGTEIIMNPLYAADRRIIHMVLSEDPEVRTYTVGVGSYRSVVIAPTKKRKKRNPETIRDNSKK